MCGLKLVQWYPPKDQKSIHSQSVGRQSNLVKMHVGQEGRRVKIDNCHVTLPRGEHEEMSIHLSEGIYDKVLICEFIVSVQRYGAIYKIIGDSQMQLLHCLPQHGCQLRKLHSWSCITCKMEPSLPGNCF